MDDVTPNDGADAPVRSADVADETLTESFRLVAEFGSDAIVVHQEGRIVYANNLALALVKARSVDELSGASIVDFVPPDGAAELFDRLTGIGDEIGSFSTPTLTAIRDLTGGEAPVRSATVRTQWNGRPAFQTMFRVSSLGVFAEVDATIAGTTHGSIDCAVITLDRDLTVESWNGAAEQMYHLPADRAIGGHWTAVTGSQIDPAAASATNQAIDTSHRRSDGTSFPVRMSVSRSRRGFVVVSAELGVSLLTQLKSVLPSLQQATLVVSADGIVELANPVALAVLSLSAELIPGMPVESLALSFPDGESPIVQCLRDGTPVTDRTALIAGPAGERRLACNCRRLDAARHSPLIVTLVDITRLDDGSSLGIYRDALTGLMNRAGIVNAVESARADIDDTRELLVCIIDLHKFATVNDIVGFDAGDQVIRTIGARIAALAEGEAAVGRIGGDQFAIVMAMYGGQAAIGELIARIHTVVTQPIAYGLRSHRVTAGVGYTTARTKDERVPVNLLRDAEIALHYAKRSPRLPFVEFQTIHRDQLHRRQHIEHDLRETLLHHPDRLRIAYQPIVKLKNKRVVALEALLRWDHPILGVILPSEFIPIAEESDLIELIGAHVQRTAGREFTGRSWTSEMILTINASRRELTDWNFPRRVHAAIRESGLAASHLCIEATESMLVAGGDVLPIIAELRMMGILIALDDFGTGASSLSQLNDLPLDFIKTAKAFTDALDKREGAQSILSAIAAIGDANGMRVVVEGVETTAQANAVARAGACFAQGYRYARPMSLDELESLVDTESPPDSGDATDGRPLRETS